MGISDAVNHLLGGFPMMQQAAVAALAIAGKPAIPILLDQMQVAKDLETRGRIGMAIEAILTRPDNRDKKFLVQLEKIVASGKFSLASPALRCIGKYKGDSEARAIAARVASENPSNGIRAQALGEMVVISNWDKSDIPFIKKFLDDSSEDVGLVAAEILGAMGDKSGVPLVMRVLQKTETDTITMILQRQAAEAAARIGDPQFIPALNAILENPARAIAQPRALQAIATIELMGIEGNGPKVAFLEKRLGEPALSYWAALHLKLNGTPEAESVLMKVAKTSKHPGKEDAQRFLEVLRREREAGAP